MNNKDVLDSVWTSFINNKTDNIHQASANAVESIMKSSISKRTLDNITVVLIGFSSYKYALFPKRDLIGNSSVDNIVYDKKNSNFLMEVANNNSFDIGNRNFSLGEELNSGNDIIVKKNIKHESKNSVSRKKNITSFAGNSNNLSVEKNANNKISNKNHILKPGNNAKKIDSIYSHRANYKNLDSGIKKK